jgi:hypothetical protein
MTRTIALVFVLLAAPALAAGHNKHAEKSQDDKTPDYPVIAMADDICTADGAFGRRFGRGYGHIDTTVSPDWAPFAKLTIETNQLRAAANFRGTTESLDGDISAAKKFLKVLIKAVDKEKFPDRKTHTNGTEFRSGKENDGGLSLMIRQDDEIISATCINEDR